MDLIPVATAVAVPVPVMVQADVAPGARRRPTLKELLKPGQMIAHTTKKGCEWRCTYNASQNSLTLRSGSGMTFTSLSAFSTAHHKHENPGRESSSNGWNECQIKQDGQWVDLKERWVILV